MTRSRPHVVVVGGGISGLAAAHALSQAAPAPRVTVIEQSSRLGGKLALQETGGVRLDGGAEAVLTRRPEAVELIRAVGLGDEVVHPAAQGAGVLIEGTLRPIPRRQLLGIPYDLRELAATGILTVAGLMRIPLDRVLPATPVEDDISIGQLVSARMGRQVVDRLVEPLLGGVYAGHADSLSLGATLPDLLTAVRRERSLLTAVERSRSPSEEGAPVFASLRGGLGRLPDAVAAASGADVLLGTRVDEVSRREGGWRVRTPDRSLDADALVLAVPGPELARLLSHVAPEAAAELRPLEYASVALVTYVFPRAAFDVLPEGTGFLVPPHEERVVKAVTYSSLKWGWLADESPGHVVLRASVGRHGEGHDLARDDDDLAWAALGEVAAVTGVHEAALAHSVTRWGEALPQYAVGHPQRVARVRDALADHPGLAVCGAALDGVGIPACVASGRAAADQVVADVAVAAQ